MLCCFSVLNGVYGGWLMAVALTETPPLIYRQNGFAPGFVALPRHDSGLGAVFSVAISFSFFSLLLFPAERLCQSVALNLQ
jgi:hypothetical protein